MIMRVKFQKGQQRKFIQEALKRINCPSLRELGSRLDVNYSTLKNYFTEERYLPEGLFKDLCYISKIDEKSLDIEYLNQTWGQVKGGKSSRKSKR
jgi:hypothetical protein